MKIPPHEMFRSESDKYSSFDDTVMTFHHEQSALSTIEAFLFLLILFLYT